MNQMQDCFQTIHCHYLCKTISIMLGRFIYSIILLVMNQVHSSNVIKSRDRSNLITTISYSKHLEVDFLLIICRNIIKSCNGSNLIGPILFDKYLKMYFLLIIRHMTYQLFVFISWINLDNQIFSTTCHWIGTTSLRYITSSNVLA